MKILVTGGFGFIGSRFVRRAISHGAFIENIDVNTYAGDERRLASLPRHGVRTHPIDVADESLCELIANIAPEVIVHFAAESHVTRGEHDAARFQRTNVEGTRQVLEAAMKNDVPLLIHVSTDEVYGPCPGAPFCEDEKLPGEGRATSAYARSKGIADDLACSYAERTPVIVVRPTNCFGPWQHPEKAIPRWTIRALQGLPIPVWGDGRHVRDWMFIEDACAAIESVISSGQPGEVYNVGPQGEQRTNLDIARLIAKEASGREDAVYLSEYDRPDHDRRYAVDTTKLQQLGWRPSFSLEAGIERTVDWFRHNRDWWSSLIGEAESLYCDSEARQAAR